MNDSCIGLVARLLARDANSHGDELTDAAVLTVSAKIALAVVCPTPKTYCRENSMRFAFGISTPPTRAACILMGTLRNGACAMNIPSFMNSYCCKR